MRLTKDGLAVPTCLKRNVRNLMGTLGNPRSPSLIDRGRGLQGCGRGQRAARNSTQCGVIRLERTPEVAQDLAAGCGPRRDQGPLHLHLHMPQDGCSFPSLLGMGISAGRGFDRQQAAFFAGELECGLCGRQPTALGDVDGGEKKRAIQQSTDVIHSSAISALLLQTSTLPPAGSSVRAARPSSDALKKKTFNYRSRLRIPSCFLFYGCL